jgi:hypothetical protein
VISQYFSDFYGYGWDFRVWVGMKRSLYFQICHKLGKKRAGKATTVSEGNNRLGKGNLQRRRRGKNSPRLS